MLGGIAKAHGGCVRNTARCFQAASGRGIQGKDALALILTLNGNH